jgi:ferredoxin-NADP reductase
VHGAFGTFLAERPAAPQLWLAGGIGITPFLALLRAGPVSQPTTLVYLYRAEGRRLSCRNCARWPNAIHNCRCRLWPPATSRRISIRSCPRQVALAGSECYLCGPPGCWPRSDSPCASAASRPAISILKTSDSDDAPTLPVHHPIFWLLVSAFWAGQPVVAAG